MYTFDTNAIIYFVKDDAKAVPIIKDILTKTTPIYLSTLSEVELFGYPDLTDFEAEKIERLLSTLSIIPLDSRVARIAAALRRQYGLKTSDSVIGATAIFTGATLVTRNIRDFRNIPNFALLSI